MYGIGLDLFLEENMTYADGLSRGAGRVSPVSADVSRLLSGNECPRDQAGRARQSRGAETLPAPIGPCTDSVSFRTHRMRHGPRRSRAFPGAGSQRTRRPPSWANELRMGS